MNRRYKLSTTRPPKSQRHPTDVARCYSIFGVQNETETLALLPMSARATFRHAWQSLYRKSAT
jgi:hypothetical protein